MCVLKTCSAIVEKGCLILQNRRIRRVFDWNDGLLVARSLADPQTGKEWLLQNEAPDWLLPEMNEPPQTAPADFNVRSVPETAWSPAHLLAEITTTVASLQMKRAFRIYPECPVIGCDYYLRGTTSVSWRQQTVDTGSLRNIEDGNLEGGAPMAIRMERLCLPGMHWRLTPVRFYDITDRRNTLVMETAHLAYRTYSDESMMAGNLLFAEETLTKDGVFFLKEAPCSDVQLAWPGFDFACRLGEFSVVGPGVLPDDLDPEEWTRCYGVATGLYTGGEEGRLIALRSYQQNLRTLRPERDEMLLMNTWGDRGQDGRICEAFALAELEAGARLGITHFQLDDGWQAGQSSNSAQKGGSLERIWDHPDYWNPHPERFPRGLGPVVERGKSLGIEVCIWFNPSADDRYAHWRQDANVLIQLYRAHGIRTFKIDGVRVPDKQAESNLRRLLDAVMEATGGTAVFNLDGTAGQRYGYHYFYEYGNLFIENRYTDWTNHYPHWTLRNLWMLSRYVPAQKLQMEFLNLRRNADKYPADDPLSPAAISFEYAFATTMMSQPLAWFEGTGLPEEAFALSSLIALYRQHMHAIHSGTILPIGEEPSGVDWTGFQSITSEGGYLLIFREYNEEPVHAFRLWRLRKKTIQTSCLAGAGTSFTGNVDGTGALRFALPAPLSFALYRYEIV